MLAMPTESWTGSSTPANLIFRTVPSGSVAPQNSFIVHPDGTVAALAGYRLADGTILSNAAQLATGGAATNALTTITAYGITSNITTLVITNGDTGTFTFDSPTIGRVVMPSGGSSVVTGSVGAATVVLTNAAAQNFTAGTTNDFTVNQSFNSRPAWAAWNGTTATVTSMVTGVWRCDVTTYVTSVSTAGAVQRLLFLKNGTVVHNSIGLVAQANYSAVVRDWFTTQVASGDVVAVKFHFAAGASIAGGLTVISHRLTVE
jgi:hypothetical protein